MLIKILIKTLYYDNKHAHVNSESFYILTFNYTHIHILYSPENKIQILAYRRGIKGSHFNCFFLYNLKFTIKSFNLMVNSKKSVEWILLNIYKSVYPASKSLIDSKKNSYQSKEIEKIIVK